MEITIEEFLTNLHNELEVVNPLSPEEIVRGRGIKWQIENATSYTYSKLTREKFDALLKELGYGK